MKSICTLLISTTLLIVCYGQNDYIPFAKPNKFWFYNVYFDSESNRVINAYVIWIGQDTILDDKTYSKLYSSNLDGSPPSPTNFNFQPFYPYRFKDKYLSDLIIEDTLNKRVYYKRQDSLALIYDFNLEIGQRLDSRLLSIIKPVNWPEKDSLGKITDVKFEESYNINRKTWIFNGPEVHGMPIVTDMRIIEGVGLIPYNGFYPSYDRLYNFCEGSFDKCGIVSNTKDEMESNFKHLILIPNPSRDLIEIKTEIDIQKSEIIDLNGRIVLSSYEKEINVSGLNSGVYVVKCLATNNKYYFKKFVKM